MDTKGVEAYGIATVADRNTSYQEAFTNLASSGDKNLNFELFTFLYLMLPVVGSKTIPKEHQKMPYFIF